MTEEAPPRFDPDAILAYFGETVLARGRAYHREGRVRLVSVEPRRVLAHVSGTEDYRVELTGKGSGIGGRCTCPAFEDRGPCKHMAATALAISDEAVDPDEQKPVERIRDYLKAKDHAALVAMIIEAAENDRALFDRLDLAASALNADDKTLRTRLKSAIDRATRTGGYIEYGAAGGWAEDVDNALDAVADLASGPRAAIALELAEHAIARIEAAIEEIDDSDGWCGDLLERAASIHAEAARAAKPDPVDLAHSLFEREMESDYDFFTGASETYAEALGAGGLLEYRRLARKLWDDLPSLHAGERGDANRDLYRRLIGILDRFAREESDVEARIALRAKDLSSSWAYSELAKFCADAGREKEALNWAEEGLWAFEDERPDQNLVDLAVGLLKEAGRKEDAEALSWRAFEKAPSTEAYKKLRALAGEAARERAVSILSARIAKARDRYSGVDTLVGILMMEKCFGPAWEAARKHAAPLHVRLSLAHETEASHPKEALETFAERVDALVQHGGNREYAEAAGIVRRMGKLRGAAEQAIYVDRLRDRHGRKRNFMKLLG